MQMRHLSTSEWTSSDQPIRFSRSHSNTWSTVMLYLYHSKSPINLPSFFSFIILREKIMRAKNASTREAKLTKFWKKGKSGWHLTTMIVPVRELRVLHWDKNVITCQNTPTHVTFSFGEVSQPTNQPTAKRMGTPAVQSNWRDGLAKIRFQKQTLPLCISFDKRRHAIQN